MTDVVHDNWFLKADKKKSSSKSSKRRRRFPTSKRGTALILVNTPIGKMLPMLWPLAQIRLCADGGANRLYDWNKKKQDRLYIPTKIIGDLDSLREETKKYYQENDCQIIRDSNQDNTDLGKCLEYLVSHHSKNSKNSKNSKTHRSRLEKKQVKQVSKKRKKSGQQQESSQSKEEKK